MSTSLSVVMLGATGAVGSRVARRHAADERVRRLTLLGRRPLDALPDDVLQHRIDIFEPDGYAQFLDGHEVAICTLGVGQPSTISRDDFVRIDKTAVLDFATRARGAGVRHFQLLSSVGADPRSRSFFLRAKGELEDDLRSLRFDRLSLFHPSMIMTPTNRYGWTQALTLAVWPLLSKGLPGRLRRFRGVKIDALADTIAANAYVEGHGTEVLTWDDFRR